MKQNFFNVRLKFGWYVFQPCDIGAMSSHSIAKLFQMSMHTGVPIWLEVFEHSNETVFFLSSEESWNIISKESRASQCLAITEEMKVYITKITGNNFHVF